MREVDIACLQKVLKGSSMNKLKKFKANHCRSLETDSALTSRECTAWVSETQNIAKCDGPASKSTRSEFSPYSIKDQKLKAGNTHKLLQRSISAAADHCHHHVMFDQFDQSSSLSQNSGVGGGTDACSKVNDKKNCSFQDILSAMRGPPYDVETFTSDDTSPLIQSDAEPFKGARNSFDNLEITETMSILTEGHSTSTMPTNDNAIVVNKCPVNAQPTSRRKPELRILSPGLEDSIGCGLKKMSAIDERQMNEAIELANSFSHLSTGSGPNTPGSLSDGCRSPGGHFFGFRKGRSGKEEKRTFAEELSLHSTETDRMVTPSALEAYEVLVKRTLPGKTDTQCAFGGNFVMNRDIGEIISSKGNQEPHPSLLALDRKCARVPVASDSCTSSSMKNDEFPSQTFPSAHRSRETFALSRSLSLGNPERSKENEEDAEVVDFILSSLTHFQEKLNEFDDLSPPAYPAPVPPSKLKMARPEPLRRRSESGKAFVDTICRSPPPLPEKKSRRVGVVLPIENSLPEYQASLLLPPAVPPPVLPPRVPLRQSTVNSRPYERRFPLASEFPSRLSQSDEAIRLDVVGHCSLPQKLLHQAGTMVMHGARSHIKEAWSKDLRGSVESQISCESDAGDVTQGSEDGELGDSVLPCLSPKPRMAESSTSLSAADQPIELNIRKVKLNAAELGLYDKADMFWDKSVSFDLPEKSQSETDLLQDVSMPIPGRYETSDSVSYEDLMEFALDRPLKTSSLHSLMCDEVCVLMKMFPNALTVEDCMDALIETFWDVHSAVKLIKLKQVMSTGVADKQQCKQALLFCRWNVNDAAHYLLTPPKQRVTPDLVDV